MTELDDIHDRIAHHLALAQERERAASAVLEAISEIEGRARTADGVAASVDHRGILTGLTLAEPAMQLSWEDLRASILSCVSAAIGDVQSQAAPLQAQLVVDPRPLEAQTETLDALDRLVRGSTAAPPAPSAHATVRNPLAQQQGWQQPGSPPSATWPPTTPRAESDLP